MTKLNFGKFLVVEPNIVNLPRILSDDVELVSIEVAIKSSDICVMLVDHSQFKQIDTELLKKAIVIDTKGIWQG